MTSINVDGSVPIGKDPALKDDKIVVQWSGQIDSALGLFIVLDREPSDQHMPKLQNMFGEVKGNYRSKVDLHVCNDMLSRFYVLIREKIIVRGCN